MIEKSFLKTGNVSLRFVCFVSLGKQIYQMWGLCGTQALFARHHRQGKTNDLHEKKKATQRATNVSIHKQKQPCR